MCEEEYNITTFTLPYARVFTVFPSESPMSSFSTVRLIIYTCVSPYCLHADPLGASFVEVNRTCSSNSCKSKLLSLFLSLTRLCQGLVVKDQKTQKVGRVTGTKTLMNKLKHEKQKLWDSGEIQSLTKQITWQGLNNTVKPTTSNNWQYFNFL